MLFSLLLLVGLLVIMRMELLLVMLGLPFLGSAAGNIGSTVAAGNSGSTGDALAGFAY